MSSSRVLKDEVKPIVPRPGEDLVTLEEQLQSELAEWKKVRAQAAEPERLALLKRIASEIQRDPLQPWEIEDGKWVYNRKVEE